MSTHEKKTWTSTSFQRACNSNKPTKVQIYDTTQKTWYSRYKSRSVERSKHIPALHEKGGSFFSSSSSFWIRFKAIATKHFLCSLQPKQKSKPPQKQNSKCRSKPKHLTAKSHQRCPLSTLHANDSDTTNKKSSKLAWFQTRLRKKNINVYEIKAG